MSLRKSRPYHYMGKGTRSGLRGEKQVASVPGHPLVRWRVRGSDGLSLKAPLAIRRRTGWRVSQGRGFCSCPSQGSPCRQAHGEGREKEGIRKEGDRGRERCEGGHDSKSSEEEPRKVLASSKPAQCTPQGSISTGGTCMHWKV